MKRTETIIKIECLYETIVGGEVLIREVYAYTDEDTKILDSALHYKIGDKITVDINDS